MSNPLLIERLQAWIGEKQFQPGAQLPAERQLAQHFAVSRSSLREAIQQLISQGVLFSRRGGGTYLQSEKADWAEARLVMPLSALLADDPGYRYDVLEARRAIESSTAWHAASRATVEDKARLKLCFEAMQTISDRDDPDLAAHADVRFHLAMAEASHNLVLLQAMRGLFDLLQSSVMQSRQKMYAEPDIPEQLSAQHLAIYQAIAAGEADAAREATLFHLDFVARALHSLTDQQARYARSLRIPDTLPPVK